MRNGQFTNDKWVPSGPTLRLRRDTVAGPFGFLNPTTAMYDIHSNDQPGGTHADLADLTDAEKQERAKIRWNARDYRKGRHVLVLPRNAPLAVQMQDSSNPHKVLLGIARMFTLFPYWDVSWLIGISFTIGCVIFIACGLFYWLPIAFPETEFPGETKYYGGISAFVGATLFQLGAILLFLESYNDRAETKFGGAVEKLFVDRLKLTRRHHKHRTTHYDMPANSDEGPPIAPQSSNDDERTLADPDASGTESIKKETSSTPSGDNNNNNNVFSERQWQWWPAWHDVRTHYIYEIGFLASFTMSVGATIFYICGILALPGIFENLSPAAIQGAYYFPYLLGGVLFALASVFYILETQPNWYTPQPYKIGWHVGLWNLVGGLGWTYAAAMGYCEAGWCEYQGELALTWASAAFAFGSALQWYESLDKYIIVIE